MKKVAIVIGVSLLASLMYFGCGGGGGSEEDTIPKLQGTWVGWIEDDKGTVEEFSLQIDGAGNVVANADTGDTGFINEGWDENVFHVLTTNRHGIMIVDDQYSHASYGEYGSIAPAFYLGALEKGVASAPIYTLSDIVANYPVGGAYTGSAGLWEGDAITMTVNADLTFSGSAPEGNFSGSFQVYDSNHGRYAGTMTRHITSPVEMDITAYISPDKTALSLMANESGTIPNYLEDFILMGLKK